ncbi:caspase family protein [Leptolyngbya sp. NIES-2104]|uniref:caspase family protein n=1 Tax=Leptolyngbya sp. NIES-2104 TaxID=1552121 RepID=UPI0006EC7F66|nr:caspase family protein [Leptolyngbya sp. NIES-2104]GAP93876.1 serine/threonine protein kinase [Leptolyngbya sp. NIES-2104]
MERKVALLIGTEQYGDGFKPLPAAPKDVAAWEEVLLNPEMGGFDKVETLIDQNHSEMLQKIEAWFRSHTKDDLALLFISGHGIKAKDFKLYFAASDSRIEKNELRLSTAVAAEFVRDRIRESKSKRQIVILDCCFSGAFGDLLAKDDGSVNLETILGAEGRVVLTSSTSTQSSFEQRDGDLSIYTHYLIEGIRTGAADLDNDGEVTVGELHDFASRKVQEESPAMNPQIIVLKKEGYLLPISKVISSPTLTYRKVVEAILESEGEIDELIDRSFLDERRKELAIDLETAQAIEFEVLEPIRQRNAKIAKYREVFSQAVSRRYLLSQIDRKKLQRLQIVLRLRDEDISEIESPIVEALGTAIAVPTIKDENPPSLAENSFSSLPVQQLSEDDLQSEKGMDYAPLREMLKGEKWEEADRESGYVCRDGATGRRLSRFRGCSELPLC